MYRLTLRAHTNTLHANTHKEVKQSMKQSAKGQKGKSSAGLYKRAEFFDRVLEDKKLDTKGNFHYIWNAFIYSRKAVFQGNISIILEFE